MPRAVLFDFNGVLVDDEPIHYQTLRRVLAEEGIGLDEEGYYRDYVGFDDRGAFRHALEAHGRNVEEESIAELCRRKARLYRRHADEHGLPTFPGALELARRLAARIPLGIVSGALRAEIVAFLRAEALLELFDPVVSADDVAASKPDPEGYRTGLRLLRRRPELAGTTLEPASVLAIEDTPAGLEAARAAGLATLAVAHTFPVAELASADRVVERLDRMDGAELLPGPIEVASGA